VRAAAGHHFERLDRLAVGKRRLDGLAVALANADHQRVVATQQSEVDAEFGQRLDAVDLLVELTEPAAFVAFAVVELVDPLL